MTQILSQKSRKGKNLVLSNQREPASISLTLAGFHLVDHHIDLIEV